MCVRGVGVWWHPACACMHDWSSYRKGYLKVISARSDDSSWKLMLLAPPPASAASKTWGGGREGGGGSVRASERHDCLLAEVWWWSGSWWCAMHDMMIIRTLVSAGMMGVRSVPSGMKPSLMKSSPMRL